MYKDELSSLGTQSLSILSNSFIELINIFLGNLGMQGDYTDIPTGIPMTASLNSVSVDLNTPVDVTGQSQQVRLSSAFNIIIHVDISVTGLGLTMNQGSGNALIWNEVNTGSAPIDPPGWQEVAA